MLSENKDRSLPRHSTNAGVRRGSRNASRASSLRLSIIEEDASYVPLPPTPTSPPKTHNRPFHRRFIGDPPRYSGRSPPTYTLWDVTGPKGEKFEDLRNNAYVARRGGWRRIGVLAAIVILLVVALAVGLAVGLRKKSNNNGNAATPAAPSSTPSPNVGPFPIGSYTFTTFLDTVSSNCTSNSTSWSCEPSVTYANSPTNSQAIFNWIISSNSADSNSASDLLISSTDNPFAINFSNVSLTLRDNGTSNERYTFSTTVIKQTFPKLNVRCDYNDTLFTADLYTSKPKSYPNNSTSSASTTSSAVTAAATDASAGAPAGGNFASWDFAVDATQSIGGGVDVPSCFQYKNGQLGDPDTAGYTVQPSTDFCSCAYKNYDP
ncbi:hypothetical protein BDR22DRAFT_27731 [Usnea florida]